MEKKKLLETSTDLSGDAVVEICGELRRLLADVFTLYVKTKNFHWHMSGPHFRDYHLLLDEHADQLFGMTDAVAERVRKQGGRTVTSIGHIARMQRIQDNDAPTTSLREAHDVCDKHGDVATTSMIEIWIDETERRTWFLFEITRRPDS